MILRSNFISNLKAAMEEELAMIEKSETWKIVEKPQHRKIIGVKWVYRTKLNVDGSLTSSRKDLL